MKNALNDIKSFSNFPGLRPNLDKYKIAGKGVTENCKCGTLKYKNFGSTYYIVLITKNSRRLESY